MTTHKTSAETNGRTCTIIIFAATLLFIVSVVITGICVRYLVEGRTQQIILITLICLLFTFGMSAVLTLEVRRRREINERKRAARRYQPVPTAPPPIPPWSNDKDYSNRTTIQA